MTPERFVTAMKQGVVSLFFIGLITYAILLALYALYPPAAPRFLKNAEKSLYLFGLPLCGITAFAIVCVMERFAPAEKNENGKLEFKAFGLTFSGPAGPVTLWVVCYLVLVASLRIVG